MHIITVTSIADSGAGSFREALELAAAYTGGELVQIQFDASLAGQVIELKSEITVSTPLGILNLQESPVRICGQCLNVDASVEMHNMEVDSLMLSESATITGTGNVINTALYVPADVDLPSFSVSAGSDAACVYLYGSFESGKTYSYASLGEGLDTFKLNSSSVISAGSQLIVQSGASLGLSEADMVLTVADGGVLEVEGELLLQGVAAGASHQLVVQQGGRLVLNGATVSAVGSVWDDDNNLSSSVATFTGETGEVNLGDFGITPSTMGVSLALEFDVDVLSSVLTDPGQDGYEIVRYIDSNTNQTPQDIALTAAWYDSQSTIVGGWPNTNRRYPVLDPVIITHYSSTNGQNLQNGIAYPLNDPELWKNVVGARAVLRTARTNQNDGLEGTYLYFMLEFEDGSTTILSGINTVLKFSDWAPTTLRLSDAVKFGTMFDACVSDDLAVSILADLGDYVNSGALQAVNAGYLTANAGSVLEIVDSTVEGFYSAGSVLMQDSTVNDKLILTGGEVQGSVRGSGNILAGSGAVVELQGLPVDLSGFAAEIEQENAYVGLCVPSLGQDATLSTHYIGAGNAYTLLSDLQVAAGSVLTLEEGVCVDLGDFSISGSLVADYETTADALICSGSGRSKEFDSGEQMTLRNANLRLDGRFVFFHEGTALSMEGGSVHAAFLNMNQGSQLVLKDADIQAYLDISGSATLTDTNVSGVLRLNSEETITLDGVTCTTLNLVGGAQDFVIGEKGLTLTGNDALLLSDFSGDTAAYFEKLGSCTLLQENARVLIEAHVREDAVLTASEQFSGGYVLPQFLSVNAGATLTLMDNVVVDLNMQIMEVEGSLLAHYTEDSVAFVSDLHSSNIQVNGGTVSLRNAAIALTGEENYIQVRELGSLWAESTTIQAAYLQVDASGSVSLRDVSMLGDVVCAGSLAADNFVHQGGSLTVLEGATLSLDGDSALSNLTVQSGAIASISGIRSLNTLTLSLGASVEISGNDFTSLASLVLTDVADGSYVELGDNDWGTMDKDEIFARLGEYAPYVTLDGITVAEWNASRFYVNNLNTSGAGSLAYAISQVNAYSGNLKPTIFIDAALSGSTLNLSSQPTISKDCEIIGHGLTIAGRGITCSAKVEMNDLTLPGITLSGSGQVIPSNVVLTNQQAVRLESAWSGSTDFSGITTTAENAYVGLYSLGNCTLRELPVSLPGGYKLVDSRTVVESGKTVVLDDGVSIDTNGHTFYLEGKLIAENAELADAITGSGSLYLRGGTLELTNASIRSRSFNMYYAATLEMTGGVFDTANGSLYVNSAECVVSLTGVEVKDDIYNMGTMVLTDVNSSGRIEAYGSTTLDGVSCTTLYVDNDSDVSVGEGGLTLTGTEAMRLTNTFTGDTARLFELGATITAENAYVGIYTLGDCTLNALPESLPGGYKVMDSRTVIETGKTVTLAEGVGIDTNGKSFSLYGKLISENTEVSDAITGSGSLYLYGGTLELTNASIRSRSFNMYYAATLEMTGGVFDTGNSSLYAGSAECVVSLTGVEVKDDISTYGTLELKRCTFASNTVTVNEGASATIQNTRGIGKLTVYVSSAAQVITGNDFSGTTVELLDLETGEVIDLSGNYWGTNDRDEIIAKISGYQEGQVILNDWIVGLPEQEFEAESLVGDTLASADTRSMTVRFSHVLDEATIAGNIYLESLLGERVEMSSWSQDNGDLTLYFDALPADGMYQVVLGAGLKNVHGKSLTLPEGASDFRLSFVADITAESVEGIRLPQSLTPGYLDIMLDGVVDGSTLSMEGMQLLAPSGAAVQITRVAMHTDRIVRVYVENLPETGEYALTLPQTLMDAAGNRLNHANSPVSFTVQSPDASVVTAETSYEGLTNGSVTVSFGVTNTGNLSVSGAKVEIWLTTDGSVTADSVLLDIATIESLAVGATAVLTRNLLLSDVPGLLAGDYQLVATVQDAAELTVLTADNTGGIGSLAVSYPPAADIKIALGGGISALSPGQSLDVIYTLSNIGTVDAASIGTVRIGLIPAGGSVADMVLVGEWDMSDSALFVGGSETFALSCAVPGDIRLGGDVQLVAVLESAVYEQPGTTENNVAVSSVIQLEKCLSIATSVDSITEGSSTRVVYTVTRTGDCSQALTVNLSSEQATRLGLPDSITIAAGQSSARVQARVVNDTDYTGNEDVSITAMANGYSSATTRLTLVDDEKPSISVQLEPVFVTEGTDTVVRGTVSIDTVSTTDTVIKLGSSLSKQLTLPSTVTIKAGETSVSFETLVVDDSTAEIDKDVKVSAAAAGFNSGSATVKVVDDDLPQVELVLSKDIVSESEGYYALTATLVRTGGSLEAISVKLQDVDGIGLILPGLIPMGAGVQSVKFTIGVVDDSAVNGERTGKIRGTITIDDCGCDASASTNGGVFESTLTVQDNDSPALTLHLSKTVLREGGAEVAVLTVTSNYVSDSDVLVRLSDGGLLNLPETITIPAGQTSVACEISALSDGVTDGTQYTTIVAAAEGFISGRGYMQVTDMDVPDLVVDSITMEGAAIAGQKVNVSVVLRNQGYAATDGTAAVEIRLSDGTVLGTVSVPAGLAAGDSLSLVLEVNIPMVSGSYSLVAEVDKDNLVSELDENNNIKASGYFLIDSGYRVTAAASCDVLYSSEVITISGKISARSDEMELANQTVMVYLYRNGSLLKTIAAETTEDGSYCVDYCVPSGMAGVFEVKAGVFSDVSETLDSVSVAGLSLGTSSKDLQWLIEMGGCHSGTITITNSGAVDLHNVQLLAESLPPNVQMLIDTPAVDIAAGQSATYHYTITGTGVNIGSQYSSVKMKAVSDEGTCINVQGYSYVVTPAAVLELSTRMIEFTANHEIARYVELIIANSGGGDTGKVMVSLPGVDWMSLYSSDSIENIPSGESVTVVLKIDATHSDVLLNAPYAGALAINSEYGGSERINFDITFVDSEKCSLLVNVLDSYAILAENEGIVKDAEVSLFNAYTKELVTVAYSDEQGRVAFSDLEAGAYQLCVEAEGCDIYRADLTLSPGGSHEHSAYVENTTVDYTFVVHPTEIEDRYELVQEVTFNTNVPAPVVVFNQDYIALPTLEYGNTYYVSFSVSNYGLVNALEYSIELPQFEDVTLTLLNPVDCIEAQTTKEFWIEVVVADKPTEEKGYSIMGHEYRYVCVQGTASHRWKKCINTSWVYYETKVKTDEERCSWKEVISDPKSPLEVETNTPDIPLHVLINLWERPTVVKPSKKVTEQESCAATCLQRLKEAREERAAFVLDLGIDSLLKGAVKNATKSLKSGWDMLCFIGQTFLMGIGEMFGKEHDWELHWMEGASHLSGMIPLVGPFISKALDLYIMNQKFIKAVKECQLAKEDELTVKKMEAVGGAIEKMQKSLLSLMGSIVNCALGPSFSIVSQLLRFGIKFAEGVMKGEDLSWEQLFKSQFAEYIDLFNAAFDFGATLADFIVKYNDMMGKGDSASMLELHPISDDDRAVLKNKAFASLYEEGELDALIDKLNRTIVYHSRGIYEAADIPDGESTDFFTKEEMLAAYSTARSVHEHLSLGTFASELEEYSAEIDEMMREVDILSEGVCASVKLQFSQVATMTREAFEGRLVLTNGENLGALKNLRFKALVRDENGVDVSEHFNIAYIEVNGLTFYNAYDGVIADGELSGGCECEIVIQYIPDRTIAIDRTATYYFGADLSYDNPRTGENQAIAITPVALDVNPSPNLKLHYFLTENVYSDDPYTPGIESAQKAEIGLLVSNSGKGLARNFTLSDFHPEFVANEQGLALELTMLGSSLNGGPLQATGTTLNFGNLEGGTTAGAVWYFQTNMHGHFENYEANFTRVDSLGNTAYMTNGTDVSLIESVNPHMLTRSMDADGDGKTDFLVNDVDDAFEMAEGFYFGDGSYADVHGERGVLSSSGTLGMGSTAITLTMYAEAGWNYFRINDPGAGNYRIEGISVGGVQLESDMFWQTDRVFAVDGSASYVPRLHWVAEFEEAGYVDFTVTYSAVDEKAPGVESISGVADKSTVREAVESLTITFDEEVNKETFSLDNIELKLQNQQVNLSGLEWEWSEDGRSLLLTNLGRFTREDGLYVLRVLNGNVEDVYGNAGDGSGQQLMWTKATSKVAVELVEGYMDRKLNTRVNKLYVHFTEAVSEFGKDAISIIYTAPDGTISPVLDLGMVSIRPYEGDNKTYSIEGLDHVQTIGDGNYRVIVDCSRVRDASGNDGTGTLPLEWALHQTPPSVVRRAFLEAEQTVQEIDTIKLYFSHAVSSVDLSKLSLTCNGEVYTSDSLRYSVDENNPTLVTVKGISKAVPVGKAAAMPDGEWQLSMDMSGVEDIYGNVGVGSYTTDWEVDTIAPAELGDITLNGKDSLIVADNTVTVGAALPEIGLRVSIYDKAVTGSGNGTLLWSGVVEGELLSQTVTLLNGGTRVLTIVTEDASGNSTTNTYNVLVDMVVLTVSTDLEAKYKEHPDSVTLIFNAAIAELPLSALSLVVNGTAVSLDGATVSKVSDTEWKLSGLSALCDTVGSYTFGVDLSQLTKSASGLAGQGSYTQSYAYDPITEVRITSCELSSEVELVTGLRMAFNADINYAALQAAGLLGAAMRLVNQEDGSVVELDAAGFAYADKVLSWSGELSLPGGHYAVVVDTALLKAANGSPLVGNAGTADTAIVDYRGDALLLGAAGTSYSAPYAVDWNGDGHADLLVGEKVGSAGKVRLYLNNGSGGFANFSYLQSNGADLSVSASGCQGVVVALQDITGDGVADLVAGLSNGEVQYFTGLEGGSFGSASTLVEASVAGSRAYPVFADWNADGVADLVLGTGSGTLMVGLGSKDAATGALSFATPTLVAGIEVPGRAAPVFTDVNADGREDLILGAGDGSLTLYYGTEGGFSRVGSWQLEGISWERSRVTVADLNADGRTDLIVGGSTGDIYVVYGAAPANRWSQQVEIEAGMAITATGVAVNAAVVTLSWTTVNTTAETRYVVEVADNADFANATVYSGLERTILTLDSHAEGVYFWRVRIEGVDKPAVNGSGYTVDTIAPGAPDSLVASSVGNTAVLTWASQTDASGVKYEVRCSATEDFSSATVITTTEPRLNVSGLPAGEWYWQVRAVDGAGNAGVWSTAAESFHIDEVETPESTTARYWAQGLVPSGAALVSGYWDADKSGTGDTQLCWAAADANMLAWWQQQYGVTDFSSSDVPESADDIFAVFRQNWANVSGREEYGLTWWISGASENGSYGTYFADNYTGSGEQGAYYAPHYDAAATSALVKEVSLTGADAEQLARDWAAVYAAGGIISLGVYSSVSGSTLVGGHALTVWGFATDAAGRLSSITVTDSDDKVDSAVTLSLAYNVTKGYYQIAQSGSNLNGRLLGDYTSLGAFDKQDDANNSVAGAENIAMSEPENGFSASTSSYYNWVGTGDELDFYEFTAPGEGIYRVNVNTRNLESALLLSVGTLDAEGRFVTTKSTQITPDSPIGSVGGLRLDDGTLQYVRVSSVDGQATSYELTVNGDIDEASPITDNNTKRKATKLVNTIYDDACVASWVGSGDALDIYYFELDEACNFSLNLDGLDKNAKVKLYHDKGDGSYGSIISTSVRANRGLQFTDSLGEGTYYLEIASYDKGAGRYNTAYTLELEKEIDGISTRLSLESDSPLTDNNTMDTATELELVTVSDAVITSWVGAGDALDYYRFEVTQAGTLSLSLSELEKNATLRLYHATDGGNKQLVNNTVRASRGLDTELDLATGTYFLEISSYDNGAGRYNSTYALELEKEEDGAVKRYVIAGSGL